MNFKRTELPLTFTTKRGREMESVLEDLATLRMAVFQDYPYLYHGSMAYEKEYLKTYADSDRSFLFAVYDHQKMAGAATCIPLQDETAEVRQPFEEAGFQMNSIFYFGESILLPHYRGRGLGHLFFDEREAHARSFGEYSLSCFCSVDRGESHPDKPDKYYANDVFWAKRGYRKDQALQSFMEWPDIGQDKSTPKKMIFWTKPLI